MKTWIWAVALAAGLSMAAASAFAAPAIWTVSGTLDGGGTFSGSFVYDADTNTYSAINITTTPGTAPGAHYTEFHVPYSVPSRLFAVPTGGAIHEQPALRIQFSTPLSNTGGARTITGQEGLCDGAGCSGLSGSVRTIAGAATSPVLAAVPTLSEWAMILFGTILAGAAAFFIQHRRTA